MGAIKNLQYVGGEGAIRCTGNPDGDVTSAKGTLCVDVATGNVYQNTDGGSTWILFAVAGGAHVPTTEHLTGAGSTDDGIVIDPALDVSFLANTEAESTLDFTLADGTIDGQRHALVNESAGDTRVIKITFDNLHVGSILTSTSMGASAYVIWNATLSTWQLLGGSTGFDVS